MTPIIMLVVVLGIPIVYVSATYNALITIRNHIRDAWANIDTELKRRYDLIPNLVAVTKEYAKHERELLESVIAQRNLCKANDGSPTKQAASEQELISGLNHLIALSEAYPELKADQAFLKLQKELIHTEDRLQSARRFYNGNVRDYRNKSQAFPSNLVAGMFNFPADAVEFFQIDSLERAPVSVELAES
ncbi:MAG: LemA family protein [Akkermansiaceae bacterium]|nr:LemA family protein [Akkermansiaceae bacterium]